jgi:hypothetical protein
MYLAPAVAAVFAPVVLANRYSVGAAIAHAKYAHLAQHGIARGDCTCPRGGCTCGEGN